MLAKHRMKSRRKPDGSKRASKNGQIKVTRFANAPFALDGSFTPRASRAVLAADKAGVYSSAMQVFF